MKKINLLGFGNYKDLNFYIFKKSSNFYETINSVFKKIFGNNCHIQIRDVNYNKKGNVTDVKRDVLKLKDLHETIHNDPRIDLFYGAKTVYLTIICENELRLKFNKILLKCSEIPKVKKFK
jgi:hypothetical protein